MPRRARIVVPGSPHHLTQRGNRKADVFRDDEDRRRYLSLLQDYSHRHDALIWAYALMRNHIHVIVVPQREESLSNTFRDAHAVYAAEFNRKYDLSGHLWQARFYSCVLDESHLWAAMRYVERNPVKAGIVREAENYPWSSAFAHVHNVGDPLLADGCPLVSEVSSWKEWLAAEDVDSEIRAIRQATENGRAWGTDAFITMLEQKLGRSLRPQRRGRRAAPPPDDTNSQTGLK